jgi:bifunctional DNase/RNase
VQKGIIVASDFKDLFGDDWKPREFGQPEGKGTGDGDNAPFPEFSAEEDGIGPNDSRLASSGFTSEQENRKRRFLNEKEVKVLGVYMHQEPGMHPQHFVLLRDNKGRKVPIWVGQFEALAISYANEFPDRPLTHDLMRTILERLGATVERVIIDDLWRETFYAKISMVKPDGGTVEIDARPSDAIALSLRVKAPIYIAESVLEATVKSE